MTTEKEEVTPWFPIETAPKDDSTRVLLYRAGYHEEQAVCWWSEHFQHWASVSGGNPFPGATHWMPLPTPPATPANAKGSK